LRARIVILIAAIASVAGGGMSDGTGWSFLI